MELDARGWGSRKGQEQGEKEGGIVKQGGHRHGTPLWCRQFSSYMPMQLQQSLVGSSPAIRWIPIASDASSFLESFSWRLYHQACSNQDYSWSPRSTTPHPQSQNQWMHRNGCHSQARRLQHRSYTLNHTSLHAGIQKPSHSVLSSSSPYHLLTLTLLLHLCTWRPFASWWGCSEQAFDVQGSTQFPSLWCMGRCQQKQTSSHSVSFSDLFAIKQFSLQDAHDWNCLINFHLAKNYDLFYFFK